MTPSPLSWIIDAIKASKQTIDMLNLFEWQIVLFMQYLVFIPTMVHAIFLPTIMSLKAKQRNFKERPDQERKLIKLNAGYTLIYTITRCVVALLIGDVISITFLGLMGAAIVSLYGSTS